MALRDRLVPIAELITPNLPEAAVLVGGPVPGTLAEMTKPFKACIGSGQTGYC